MVPFSFIITYDGTITFTHYDGTVHHVSSTNINYHEVKTILRAVDPSTITNEQRDELLNLSKPVRAIHVSTSGRVRVEDGDVYYDGKVIKSFLAERILWMLEGGFSAAPMLAFLENVKQNPSNRAVEELYRFMEENRMGLTHDGYILTYKRVTADYKDIRTGTFDNRVGTWVTMPRNEVDDDPRVTCSHGLHVCAEKYLGSFASAPNNRIVICKVHPKDVVSVPFEYHNAKMRVCKYIVIEDVTDKVGDVLSEKAVFDFVGEEVDDDRSLWQSPFDEELPEDNEESAQDSFRKSPVADWVAEHSPVIKGIIDSIVELGLNDPKETVEPDKGLDEIGLDDFDLIELIMKLEEKFNTNINEDDKKINISSTISDFADFIGKLLK